MFVLDNLKNGEELYQRCILVTGRYAAAVSTPAAEAHVVVETKDNAGQATFPGQHWPMCQGWFKALVILSPGSNKIIFKCNQHEDNIHEVVVKYTPLLQTPPLHLAIMIAKDSPLLIDCPDSKYGALSNAHSGLEAAVAKFRMTAYMWQALTAEDLRANGLGRRSFRLEEEWGTDTLSRALAYTDSSTNKMQSTAKIHLIRADKTVDELRNAQLAQQNPHGTRRDELHQIFTEALKSHGAPFLTEAHPVVAGLILDSHYDTTQNMILAHAALGAHNPKGLSLGIFGSHLTYAWPRFLEEVPDCLSDLTPPGDRVGNDNNECASMWEACAVGQGAFLHEVGHAFSAPHTTGIMARGYSPDWAKCFLSSTAQCVHARADGVRPITADTKHDCHWDLRDMLRFRSLAHFRLPGDVELPRCEPVFELIDDEDFPCISVECKAGIARVTLDGEVEDVASVTKQVKGLRFPLAELEARFDAAKPLSLEVTGMNGMHRTIDVWKFFSNCDSLRVPGTAVRLYKKAVGTDDVQPDDWQWAVMLKKRGRNGELVSASKIDVRVGCGLDGAEVYYKDNTKIPCGPRGKHGDDPGMGGHQARKIAIPRGVDVVKVGVTNGGYGLSGLRIWLSNGQARGALNKHHGTVEYLVPAEDQRIIGFYGTSGQYGMCSKFGIVTGPKDVELPVTLYDMEELQNNREGRNAKRRRHNPSATEDGSSDTSEDEDDGYDNDSDIEED